MGGTGGVRSHAEQPAAKHRPGTIAANFDDRLDMRVDLLDDDRDGLPHSEPMGHKAPGNGGPHDIGRLEAMPSTRRTADQRSEITVVKPVP